MNISIIIPTYNEAENISTTLQHLKTGGVEGVAEIIVSDSGSEDDTLKIAERNGAVAINSPLKGRAGQMNHALKYATGDVYYFVHADCHPPTSYINDIKQAVKEGFSCGSFRTAFRSNKTMLKVNAFFTRFDYLFFRGGDQSIFVTKDLMQQVGPYKEDMLIMEDYDFLQRIKEQGKFKLIPKPTMVSARKYDENSWLRVQLANYKVVKMYRNGASQEDMIKAYKEMLNYRDNSFDE